MRVPFALRGFGADSGAAAAAATRVSAAAASGASSGLALALSAAGLPVAAVALPRAPLVSAAVTVTVGRRSGKPRAQLLVDFAAASAEEEDAPAHARTPRASGMRSRRVSDAAGRDSDGGRVPRRSDVALAVDGGDAPRVSRTSRA